MPLAFLAERRRADDGALSLSVKGAATPYGHGGARVHSQIASLLWLWRWAVVFFSTINTVFKVLIERAINLGTVLEYIQYV